MTNTKPKSEDLESVRVDAWKVADALGRLKKERPELGELHVMAIRLANEIQSKEASKLANVPILKRKLK